MINDEGQAMAHDGGRVHGTVAAGFDGVREEFAAVLGEMRDAPEAQLVVHVDGRRVVNGRSGSPERRTVTTLS